jgi:hypothetical protein
MTRDRAREKAGFGEVTKRAARKGQRLKEIASRPEMRSRSES